MIAQLPDPSSYVAMGWLIAAMIALGGGYLLYLNIMVARKKLAAPALPTGQQPQPFVVKEAEVYVKMPEFENALKDVKQEIKDVEGRLNDKVDENKEHSEKIFRDRFHKIDEELHSIGLNAKNAGELATEQFQNIEGRLGELKSTTEHTNALAVRTDQRVQKMAEDLPDKIANAVNRGRRT